MQFGRKKSLIDRAQDYVEQVSETVLPQLEAALEQAVDKAGPALADARDRAKPLLADGKALAAEKAATGAALAAEKAAAGRELAATKVAEIKGEPEPQGGKLKKLLLLGGLAAIGAVVFGKLKSRNEDANWQSSYVPTPPAPKPTTTPDDTAGAAPGEAISDAVEEPHAATTPDEPADVIDVDDVPADKP